ncbi:MAG: lytic transglycosylase domain-containing protein [bacterium]
MSEKTEKKMSQISPMFKSFVAILVVVVIVVSSYKQCGRLGVSSFQENHRITDLEKTLQDIRAAMNIDSVRQYNIQKVMEIISKYNTDLRSSLKYEIAEEIFNMSVKYTNLDVELLCATITQESGGTWNPEIVSKSGAMGLMQVMPIEGMWIAHYENITWTTTEEILFDPIYNIRIGSRHLSALINLYGLEGGLAAYNGGSKKAAIWLANNRADGILWEETSNYLPLVFKLYEEFKTISL